MRSSLTLRRACELEFHPVAPLFVSVCVQTEKDWLWTVEGKEDG